MSSIRYAAPLRTLVMGAGIMLLLPGCLFSDEEISIFGICDDEEVAFLDSRLLELAEIVVSSSEDVEEETGEGGEECEGDASDRLIERMFELCDALEAPGDCEPEVHIACEDAEGLLEERDRCDAGPDWD